jgi:hypothetical protein
VISTVISAPWHGERGQTRKEGEHTPILAASRLRSKSGQYKPPLANRRLSVYYRATLVLCRRAGDKPAIDDAIHSQQQ